MVSGVNNSQQVYQTQEVTKNENIQNAQKVDLSDPVDKVDIKKSSNIKKDAKIGAITAGLFSLVGCTSLTKFAKSLPKNERALVLGTAAAATAIYTAIGAGVGALSGKIVDIAKGKPGEKDEK